MMSEFEKLILEAQEKAAEMARREANEKQAVGLSRRLSEASFLTDEQRLQLFGGTMEEYQKALDKSRKRP